MTTTALLVALCLAKTLTVASAFVHHLSVLQSFMATHVGFAVHSKVPSNCASPELDQYSFDGSQRTRSSVEHVRSFPSTNASDNFPCVEHFCMSWQLLEAFSVVGGAAFL